MFDQLLFGSPLVAGPLLGNQARDTSTPSRSPAHQTVYIRVQWCVLQYGRPLGSFVYGVGGAFARDRYARAARDFVRYSSVLL